MSWLFESNGQNVGASDLVLIILCLFADDFAISSSGEC